MSELTIREAVLADVEAIAALHVRSWRAAYRHLAPAEVFAALDEPLRVARWGRTLSEPADPQVVLVAETAGRLAGVGAASAPSEAVFGPRGELKSIYVDPDFKRGGIGRRLMAELAGRLKAWDYGGAALGVVSGNDPAIAFYKALGGREIGTYVDPGPLWRSQNIVLVWDDLAVLTAFPPTS